MLVRVAAGLLAVLAFVCLAPSQSEAAFSFGTDEKITKIQDIPLTGPDGEALFLGYKTSTTNFLAGVWIKDDGYVIGFDADRDKYVPLTAEEIAGYQAAGMLPDPLPPYSLSTMDYVLGYSLWTIILPILLIYLAFSYVRSRSKRQAAA